MPIPLGPCANPDHQDLGYSNVRPPATDEPTEWVLFELADLLPPRYT